MQTRLKNEINESLDEIILGRNIKRGVHLLRFKQEKVQSDFIDRLKINGFSKIKVAEAQVQIGQRIPAFLVTDEQAIFGYIFWEVFSRTKKRKLWGSEIKNAKGDWKYIITEFKMDAVWANIDLIEEVNIPAIY